MSIMSEKNITLISKVGDLAVIHNDENGMSAVVDVSNKDFFVLTADVSQALIVSKAKDVYTIVLENASSKGDAVYIYDKHGHKPKLVKGDLVIPWSPITDDTDMDIPYLTCKIEANGSISNVSYGYISKFEKSFVDAEYGSERTHCICLDDYIKM